jgi:YHS domain-containing protein
MVGSRELQNFLEGSMVFIKKSFAGVVAAGVLVLHLPIMAENDSLPEKKENASQTTCPIMGGDIDKDTYADHDGKRVYFCCSMCESTFKKDPVKYINKLESMGQVLELVVSDTKGDKSAIPKKAVKKMNVKMKM